MNPPPYLWVYVLFVCLAIALLMLLGIAAALKSAGKTDAQIRHRVQSAALLLFGWMAAALILGGLGLFRSEAAQTFPFIAIAIAILLPIFAGAVLIRRSAAVSEILHAVPQSWLVGVQGYRGFGAIFLVLLGMGYLPEVFALPAGFGDVLVGLGALLVAGAYAAGYAQRRGLVRLWNILGIADLAVAVGTGFLSSPTPLQMLAFDHPNVIAGAFPLVMIPIFAVPLSIILHIASLTKLARERRSDLRAAAVPAGG